MQPGISNRFCSENPNQIQNYSILSWAAFKNPQRAVDHSHLHWCTGSSPRNAMDHLAPWLIQRFGTCPSGTYSIGRAVRAVHASLVLRLLEKKTGDAKFRVCRTKLKSLTISRGWDKLDVFYERKWQQKDQLILVVSFNLNSSPQSFTYKFIR